MGYKIVFFDVDGTITHHEDGSIPYSTIEAIKTLKSKGIKVVAATGRPLSMCKELKELGIETFITANGGYVKHNHEVKSVTLDFQINNGNFMNQDFSFFSNFVYNDITVVKESEKEIYEKPIKHSIEVINKDELRFTSKFDISEIGEFNLNDYVIRVNMGSLSANIPVELEKVKIDIN